MFVWLATNAVASADEPWKVSRLADGSMDLSRGAVVWGISFPRDNIVEFDYRPDGKTGAHSPVLTGIKGSVAPVETPSATEPGTTVYTTAGMRVSVRLPVLEIKIADSTGKPLCKLGEMSAGGFMVKHDPYSYLGNTGDIWAGFQGSNGGPFVWTTAGYGLLWDSDGGGAMLGDARGPSNTVLTVGRNSNIYPRPDLDLYVMVGSPRTILADLADLSGHAPMFPKWNMGFMVTRWGFDEKEELQNVDLFLGEEDPVRYLHRRLRFV